MDVFSLLFTNLLPLYVLIGLGFVAGRFFEIDRHTLANMAIYICMPVVVFGFVADLEFQPVYAFLPIGMFAAQAVMGLGAYYAGHKIYGDNRANLLAMCVSMGNYGYFGLPLMLLLFDAQWVGVYMFLLLGVVVYESSFGYYFAARGKFDVRGSLRKLIMFPGIYAVFLGLAVNFAHVEMPELFYTYWGYFKGAYVVIGMMIIGASLSKVERLVFAPRFLTAVFAGKFLLWPLMAFGVVALDQATLNLFGEEVHRMMIVLALVPPAANIAAFAAQFGIMPEKAATTILLSTVFALFYIPAALVLLGIY